LDFGFASAFWLLLLVPILWQLVLREESRRMQRLAKLGEIRLLSQLAVGVDVKARKRIRFFSIVAYALLVVSLAGPRIGSHTELLPRRGLDIVFAVDVSKSMRARDVAPDRLERAKAEIEWSLSRLENNRIGLIAFAGSAFVQCPLTTDVEAMRSFLRSLDPATVTQGGTSLAAGLKTALNLFLAEEEYDPSTRTAGRVLVVVSDGEDHEGGLEKLSEAVQAAGIETILIGVGSGLGEPIPVLDKEGRVVDYMKDREKKTIMTRMSPDVLTSVAGALGGRFVDGTREADLGLSWVENKVKQLEKRELEKRVRTQYVDRSIYFLLAAIFFMILAFVLSEREKPKGDEKNGFEKSKPIASAKQTQPQELKRAKRAA
jgi:Ca-activated chloride channel homolog